MPAPYEHPGAGSDLNMIPEKEGGMNHYFASGGMKHCFAHCRLLAPPTLEVAGFSLFYALAYHD